MLPRRRPFEWFQIVRLLGTRFGDLRLAQTAASLTFTSLVSLVPLFALAFALFTAFPAFRELQHALQQRFADALLPPQMATTVLHHLDEFAAKAKSLGALGIAGLVLAATSMLLTVDRALNAIWRTARPRPLAQRVLVYWAALTLGPLLLGAALTASGALLAADHGWLRQLHGGADVLLTLASWLLMGSGLGALYRYVPNTEVRWRDALAGGVAAAAAFDLAGRAFAWYIASVPTYTVVYGAFATLPLFLLWIDWSWMVVLLGAMLAASLPLWRVRARVERPAAGAAFVLALRVLRALDDARAAPQAGLDLYALAAALRCDPLRLPPLLDTLEALGWLGRVSGRPPRWALLVDPHTTTAAALIDRLLLDHALTLHTLPPLDAPLRALLDSNAREQSLHSLLHAAADNDALTR
jgi:membrane protein